MDDFDSEFDSIVSSLSLEELSLLDELDNPTSVAALNSLLEPYENNEKHNLRSFDKADNKDDVENYLYSGQDKFFVNFVSDEKNYGLFAKESFQKGDFVLFYRGTRLTRDEYFEKLNESELANEYIFTDERNDLYIDATDVALTTRGIARYANDECRRPNLKAKSYVSRDGMLHIQLVALRNIAPGEEIVYNYGTSNLPWRKGNLLKERVMQETETAGQQGSRLAICYNDPDNGTGSEDENQERGRSKKRTFKRSARRLKSSGTEECFVCLKRVQKIWQHIRQSHNLEDINRRFLNSYYRTRNAKSAVYECSFCVLRIANDRLHKKIILNVKTN